MCGLIEASKSKQRKRKYISTVGFEPETLRFMMSLVTDWANKDFLKNCEETFNTNFLYIDACTNQVECVLFF